MQLNLVNRQIYDKMNKVLISFNIKQYLSSLVIFCPILHFLSFILTIIVSSDASTLPPPPPSPPPLPAYAISTSDPEAAVVQVMSDSRDGSCMQGKNYE